MKYRLGLTAEPIENTIDARLEGVGLIKSEYLCKYIDAYITLKTCQKFFQEYLSNLCDVFYPHEVWYRTIELSTPELNILKGVDYILEETDSLLGLRGIRRSIKFLQTFETELNVVTEVAQKHPNLHIFFPFINDPKELKTSIRVLKKVNFPNKYGIMAEIPSAILLLENFIDLGVTNITVGTNDLTTMLLGTNRNEYHDNTHPAVIKLIEMALNIGKKRNIPITVAGKVNKKLEKICKSLDVDYFIVNYELLEKVLDIPKYKLTHLNLQQELKQITQAKISQREREKWFEIFKNEQ